MYSNLTFFLRLLFWTGGLHSQIPFMQFFSSSVNIQQWVCTLYHWLGTSASLRQSVAMTQCCKF